MEKCNQEKILVSAKEAAGMMSVSMPTFYQLSAMDGFPSFRIGKKILVNVGDLKEWVSQQYGSTIA